MELDNDLRRMLLEIRDETTPVKTPLVSPRIRKRDSDELATLHRQQVIKRLLYLELIEETRASVSKAVPNLPDGSSIRPRHRKVYVLTKKGHAALKQG